jgi:hypothetical protein
MRPLGKEVKDFSPVWVRCGLGLSAEVVHKRLYRRLPAIQELIRQGKRTPIDHLG